MLPSIGPATDPGTMEAAGPVPRPGASLQDFLHSDLMWLLELDAALWLWVWLVPTLVLRFRWLPSNIQGVAFPGLVLVRAETFTKAILRHELTHVRQMRRWSPLGTWLAQAWSYLLRPCWILARHRRWPGLWELYYGNPLEREAFAAMNEEGPLPPTWGVRPGEG